ncbi:hypothetical protein [Herbaspirillum sp. RV1423]|uniref:hypothetical protein n=1 Tax=Herbaspirillum sp. RV1423 TaxID=1443993 RepID=UPI00055630C4|nr:hypothetical protein [Herbaspirillum sp. RV1423]
MKTIIFAILTCLAGSSFAQTVDQLTFVQALKQGRAEGPIPAQQQFQEAAAAMQARTGSAAAITVLSFRISQFDQQPSCGRIGFGLYQKSTNTFWSQSGGQMNICENGYPPNRICPDEPNKLVPFNATCANGKNSVDTPEVAAAIASAIKGGSLSMEEVSKRMHAAKPAAPTK